MSNFIPRLIADNYIRNGGFEDGTIRHWNPPTGFLSYTILGDSNFGSLKCLYGVVHTGAIEITHKDFIPVREGEHIDVTLQTYGASVITIGVLLECFNSTYKDLIDVGYTSNTAGSGYEVSNFNFRIPKNVAFIRLKTTYNKTAGTVIRIGDIGLRIQDSRDAITKNTQLEDLLVASSTPVNPAANQTYTFRPTGPELVYTIKGIHWSIPAPAGSTTGAHYLNLLYGANQLETVSMSAVYNQNIVYNNNAPVAPFGGITPTSESLFYQVIRDLKITEDQPLVIKYSNNTNAAHALTRTYSIVYQVDLNDNLPL